ncbi:MAG: T9SS type A sorting domain-containing protein [Aureispira sp.]
MLKIFLLGGLLLSTIFASYAQINSSCNRSTAFSAAFDEDVQELAILDMLASGTTDSNSISVIPSYSQDIFRALAAVANTANTSSEADSIFNLYCIHNNLQVNSFANYQLFVSLDANVPWTSNWMNLSVPSGNPTIDNLLAGQTYSLRKPFFSISNLVLLEFNNLVNIKPIIQQLTGLNGINYIEGNPLVGDASHITHSKIGNISYLNFTLGWDDCTSGCIRERTWSFSVDLTTCSVSYLGVTGSNPSSYNLSPPSQPGCNILLSTASVLEERQAIQVFPNPATKLLNIEGEIQQIKLYNSIGSLIFHKTTSTNLETIDISQLTKGIYRLIINDTITKTIVKQ